MATRGEGARGVKKVKAHSPGVTKTTNRKTIVHTIPFVRSGAVTVSTSPLVTPRYTISIAGLSVTLAVAGSTDTVVKLFVDGTNSPAVTVTVPATKTYAYTELAHPIQVTARKGTYGLVVSAAGTGAVDMGGEIEYIYETGVPAPVVIDGI